MRAVAAMYLLLPQIPMLFMGEEWGAAQPFPFFCDFEANSPMPCARAARGVCTLPGISGSGEARHAFPTHSPRAPSPRPSWTGTPSIPDRLPITGTDRRTSRVFVPLLPEITRGGSAKCYGAGPCRCAGRLAQRGLVLTANLSSRRVDFPNRTAERSGARATPPPT